MLRFARNDVETATQHTAVIPRACGGSSTPRPTDSITDSLEYWVTRPSAQLRTRRSGDLATHYAQGLHLRLALFNQSGHSLDVDADAATLTRQDRPKPGVLLTMNLTAVTRKP